MLHLGGRSRTQLRILAAGTLFPVWDFSRFCVKCNHLSLSSTAAFPVYGRKLKFESETVWRGRGGTFWYPGRVGIQARFLWGWLNSVFNRVDDSRIEEVGPDRACAEWLLRCGAGVKWDKGSDEWLRDYNSLPVGSYRTLKIVEIDATDSAVMHIGFPHFRGVQHVKKVVFHRCHYMEDEAIRRLSYLKDTLEELQLSSCGNITDEGILTLGQLKKLKKLRLYDLLAVQNRKKCTGALQESLPMCDIYFPFARESDRDPEPKS